MGDPAGEKQNRRGAREVFGGEGLRAGMEKVPRVVERHDDHDDAAQQVERLDTEFLHSLIAIRVTCEPRGRGAGGGGE